MRCNNYIALTRLECLSLTFQKGSVMHFYLFWLFDVLVCALSCFLYVLPSVMCIMIYLFLSSVIWKVYSLLL